LGRLESICSFTAAGLRRAAHNNRMGLPRDKPAAAAFSS